MRKKQIHMEPSRRPVNVRRKNVGISKREQKLLIRLVTCSLLFVFMVAGKLLLPEYMSKINARLAEALHRNMDIQTVFSSISQTFNGKNRASDTAEEVYRAVFLPEAASNEEFAVIQGEAEAALETLQTFRISENPDLAATETEEVQQDNTMSILYSQENLPEGVSMEPHVLGFPYCRPVEGSVSSDFGYREHPLEGEERFHYGIDLVAEQGTEIVSFADGTVTVAGESSSYGKYCIIAHENGYSTLYAHCNKILVSSGSAVKMGEVIAQAGQTGMATGSHLHFEVQQNQVYLNPMYYVS